MQRTAIRYGSRALVVVALLVAHPSMVSAVATDGGSGEASQVRTPTASLFLPNVTKTLGGATGWQTPFIVQNIGTVDTELRIEIRRFGEGAVLAERVVPRLAPGTSFALVPNNEADLPDNSQFGVRVRSYGSRVVAVVNQHQGVGARAEALSYNGLSSGARTVYVPYVAKAANGWLTTLIMQNVSDIQAGRLTARFVSLDGTRTATIERMLFPLETAFIDPTVEAALVAGTEYSATITSDLGPFAVVVNGHNDAPSVAAPRGFSYNGAQPTGRAYLPYVVRNVSGKTTRIVVQNGGLEATTPVLTFRALSSGALATVTAPAAVAPGAAWSFDPSLSAAVPDGEHAAVVSGGAFSAVGLELGPTTALGYAGSGSPASRLHLPNVTRTLGGSTGWTTPLVIQSAGGTTATLRWYRFADGALVRTQELTGLSLGASVRVDPRTVPGLAEDTQYAVVIDANGPVHAIVTELQLQGGDGAMAYEGFPVSTAPTIDELLARCPTAAEVASINADLTLAFEKDPTAGTLACRAAAGSADLTPMKRRIYQTILAMRQLSFTDPLPWTSKGLYQWFIDAIDGIRFTDTEFSFCCEPANMIVIGTAANMYHITTDRWSGTFIDGGLRDTMVLLMHEARHNEGKPHTCGSSDNTVAEMGSWGVQYSIFRWLAERADPLFVLPLDDFPTRYRDGARSAAEQTRSVRFCQPGG